MRFSAGFFAANVVVVLLYRSGPVLLELLTRDTVAVGYLSLALSITMLLVSVLTQYMASFVPMLALFHTRGQRGDAGAWLERLMRFSGVLIGVILIGMLLLTYPVAPRLFGADFGPVSRIFLLLGLPLLIQPLVWAGRYAATAFGQPRVAFIATMAGMLAALLASLLLIPTLGAIGAVLALAAGIFLMGAALLLTSPWLRPPWRAWLFTFAPILALLPLLDPTRPLLPSLLLTAGIIPVYLLLLWLLRVVTLGEVRRTVVAFRGAANDRSPEDTRLTLISFSFTSPYVSWLHFISPLTPSRLRVPSSAVVQIRNGLFCILRL